MPDRRGQIITLLQTRDDHLPQPIRRTHVDPGFRHAVKADETCPDCLANGRVMFGCETCHGAGRVTVQRDRDPYETQAIQKYGIDARRHELVKERDAQIERLDAQLAPPRPTENDLLADANQHPYGWERARDRKWANYDYAVLDRALERLREHDLAAYHLVHSVYVYAWLWDISTSVEAIVERGIAFIDTCMPDPIRSPSDQPDPQAVKESLWRGRTDRHEERRRERERRLWDGRALGISVADLAAVEGITVRHVRRIIGSQERQAGEAA